MDHLRDRGQEVLHAQNSSDAFLVPLSVMLTFMMPLLNGCNKSPGQPTQTSGTAKKLGGRAVRRRPSSIAPAARWNGSNPHERIRQIVMLTKLFSVSCRYVVTACVLI